MNDEIKETLDFKKNADYKKLSCDEITILKDYITNLQQENENLKKDRKYLLQYYNEDYKSRIEKAVEYINYYGTTPEENDDTTCRHILKSLLDILNGKE